ncbi:MAG: preprotein translocase subunit SecE [Rhodovarius sp.]|nr:preprotein translocase subunit SecE [Rhodovarius sp.]MCX7932884.1 preprotein translocase subunit SecE [Rhodovarius sp.]MDW8315541.1 preprotein translocase subunit SecE [Rhodovarius sp.]
MAEQKTEIEFVEVKAQDILAERQAMWNSFIAFTKVAIAATATVLILLYLIWG